LFVTNFSIVLPSAIVELQNGEYMLSRNSGKGMRSKSAAPSERNALYTRDPVTNTIGHLQGVNFAGAKKANGILVTCDKTGLVDRAHYTSNSVFRTSHALFVRSRNVKFICKDRKIMFAPPYLRTNNCQGLSSVPSTGEGGKLSNFFTNLMTSLFKNLSSGCEKLLRFKLKEAITIKKLKLSTGAAAVARRWSIKPDLEISIYDVRRALSTSILSARDASRSWAAAGGSAFLPLAMAEVLSKHLSIANHSEQVAQQYYKQSSPVESARLFADANQVQKGETSIAELANVDLTGTAAEVEAKIERMHRFIAWISLEKLANDGRIRWEDGEKTNKQMWVMVALVLFFSFLIAKQQWLLFSGAPLIEASQL